MGVTAETKLEIAKRSYDLLVNKYGLKPQDIIFDPLVFPVGTGDEQYIGSAKATVEGIRLIKEKFPEVFNDSWCQQCFIWLTSCRQGNFKCCLFVSLYTSRT